MKSLAMINKWTHQECLGMQVSLPPSLGLLPMLAPDLAVKNTCHVSKFSVSLIHLWLWIFYLLTPLELSIESSSQSCQLQGLFNQFNFSFSSIQFQVPSVHGPTQYSASGQVQHTGGLRDGTKGGLICKRCDPWQLKLSVNSLEFEYEICHH